MPKGGKRRKKRRSQFEAQRHGVVPAPPKPVPGPGVVWARSVLASVGVDRFDHPDLERRRVAWRVSWGEVIDRLVMQHAPGAMVEALRRHFDGSDLDLRASKTRTAILLHRNQEVQAVVTATVARPMLGEPIHGDFTTSGPHWGRLSKLLRAQYRRQLGLPEEDAHVVPAPPTVAAVVTAFPSTSEAFLAEVLVASARIRTDRCLDFDRPVTIERREHRIRFKPITMTSGTIELPFEYVGYPGSKTVTAALRLGMSTDPLPIVCSARLEPEELVAAWGHALIAYAHLTCGTRLAPLSVLDDRARTRLRLRSVGTSDSRGTRRLAGTGRRRQPWFISPVLEPSERTIEVIDAWVAGYRRRLAEGQCASDEAKLAAAQVGITIGPGETWVRPHARGVPTDAELRFRWTDGSAWARAKAA